MTVTLGAIAERELPPKDPRVAWVRRSAHERCERALLGSVWSSRQGLRSGRPSAGPVTSGGGAAADADGRAAIARGCGATWGDAAKLMRGVALGSGWRIRFAEASGAVERPPRAKTTA